MPRVFIPIVLFVGKIFLSSRAQIVLQWKLSDGDSTLCINYPLKSTSLVFDLGGYKGDWSAIMYEKYHCTIYIFEPVKEYIKSLEDRFRGNKNIHIFPYGLAGKAKSISLHMSENATSEFGTSDKLVKVRLVAVSDFMKNHKIKHVDLASINIEGGEYELLEHMISSKLIQKFKNVQVQLHPFVSDALLKAKKIQKGLRKTHTLLYQFPFVWESWKVKTVRENKT